MNKIENISNMIKKENSSQSSLQLCKTLAIGAGALLLIKLDSVQGVINTIESIIKYPFNVFMDVANGFQSIFYIPVWVTALLVFGGLFVGISSAFKKENIK